MAQPTNDSYTSSVNGGIYGGVAAPALTLTGPAPTTVGVTSGNFTVTLLNGKSAVTVTPATTPTATITPSSFTVSKGSPTAYFTVNSLSAAVHLISIDNNKGITNPVPVTLTVAAMATPTLTLTQGQTSSTVGVAATGWSVANSGTVSGAYAVAASPGEVTFTNQTGTLAAGGSVNISPTPLTSGSKSISLTSTTSGATIVGSPKTLTGVAAPTPSPPPPAPAPAPGSTLTSLTLNAPSAGTHAWAAGHAFKQGDLASSATLANVQCNVVTTWPDGSAKFTVLAGVTTLPASTDTAVALTLGTAPSGTTLTTADLQAAITQPVTLGVSGAKDWTFDTNPLTVGESFAMTGALDEIVSHTYTVNNGAAITSSSANKSGTSANVTGTLSGGTVGVVQTATAGVVYRQKRAIASVTKATNARITFTAAVPGWSVGNTATLADLGGMVELNGLTPTITAVDTTSSLWIEINVDSTSFGTYTSGGTALRVQTNSASKTTVAWVRTGGGLEWNGSTGNTYAASNVSRVAAVSWSGADWLSPHRVVATGPLMSQWVYRKPMGTDPNVVAWIEVRLWSNGAVEVLPWVENGQVMITQAASQNATWNFTLGGTQRESIAANFAARTRLVLITGTKLAHWVGTDPGVVALHNATYLKSTKLVPNHTAASTTSHVSSWPETITTPQEQGRYPSSLGSAGAHESIGLLPQWDAMYLTLGGAKVWRILQQQGYRAGRWGIHYRDENTLRPAQASLHTTRVFANGGIGDTGISSTGSVTAPQTGTVPPVWKVSHHPSMGFVAALVSGRWFHVETTQFVASIQGLYQSDQYRRWNAEPMAYRLRAYMQPRGFGWAVRTLGQAIAITPTSDPMRAEFENHMASTISFNHARYVGQTSNPLGMMSEYNPDNIIPIPGGPFIGQTFMQNFIIQSMGYARHLTADAVEGAKFSAWFSWAAQSVTGRLGINPATEYLYRDAENPYQFVFSTATQPNWNDGSGPWVPNWSQVWQETTAVPYAQAPLNGNTVYRGYTPPYNADAPVKELGDGTLRGGGLANPQNYWHNFMPALAYCVEFGAPGALAGYERVTGASNFNSGVATFDGLCPHWAVRPRGFEWAASLPTNTWTSLAGTSGKAWAQAGGIPAGAYQGTDPLGALFTAYCDPAWDEAKACQYFFGGGHGDGSCNAVVKLDWNTLTYSLAGLPTPPAKYPPIFVNGGSSQPGPLTYPSGVSGNGFFLSAPPLTEAVDLPYATPIARSSSHMYGAAVLAGSVIHYMYLRYAEFNIASGTWVNTLSYNFNTDLIALNSGYAPFGNIQGLDVGTSSIYDEVTNRIYSTLNAGDNSGGGRNGVLEFNPTTRDCVAGYALPSNMYGTMTAGQSWTRVGRKIYCFKREQTSYSSPSVHRRGFIFDMDTKAFQWFTLVGDDPSDSTYPYGAPQETLPCVWDGVNFWRWNFSPTAKRNQLLNVNLTPTGGAGTTANPFTLTQTVRPISGTIPGSPAHIWKRLVALRPGLLGVLHDASQNLVAVKLS